MKIIFSYKQKTTETVVAEAEVPDGCASIHAWLINNPGAWSNENVVDSDVISVDFDSLEVEGPPF